MENGTNTTTTSITTTKIPGIDSILAVSVRLRLHGAFFHATKVAAINAASWKFWLTVHMMQFLMQLLLIIKTNQSFSLG